MTVVPTVVGQLAHNQGQQGVPSVAQIRIDDQVLSAFCQRHHIRCLALFGSVLRPQDFREDSDLDVLVDFEPGHVPGFAFVDLADELSVLLGRRVDLHTPSALSPDFREAVVREAEVLYGATAPA